MDFMSTMRLLALVSAFLFSIGTAFAQISTIAVAANMKDKGGLWLIG
jgi:hypothetical protein